MIDLHLFGQHEGVLVVLPGKDKVKELSLTDELLSKAMSGSL